MKLLHNFYIQSFKASSWSQVDALSGVTLTLPMTGRCNKIYTGVDTRVVIVNSCGIGGFLLQISIISTFYVFQELFGGALVI